MPIVNFAVPTTLDKQIIDTIRKRGFQSRAEFFRFAAINYINLISQAKVNEEARTAYLTKELEKVLAAKLRGREIPSIEEQLIDA